MQNTKYLRVTPRYNCLLGNAEDKIFAGYAPVSMHKTFIEKQSRVFTLVQI